MTVVNVEGHHCYGLHTYITYIHTYIHTFIKYSSPLKGKSTGKQTYWGTLACIST
jgi:hypothetical protein